MPRTRNLIAITAIAALAGATGLAGAADPKPVPCNGLFLTDAPDDGRYGPAGTADPDIGPVTAKGPAPDNLEVLNTFVNAKGGQVTANLTLKNLTKEIPEGVTASGGVYYYFYWVHNERIRFVRAVNADGGEIAYGFGYVTSETYGEDPAGGVYQTEGETTGTFSEGPEGVVSIVIPPDIGGKVGEKLAAFAGSAETIEGKDDFTGFNHQADEAPDDYSQSNPSPESASLTVAACPEEAGGTTPPATTPPATTPPTGGGTGTTPANSGPPATSPTATGPAFLPLKAVRSLGSAKKAKKKKSLTFKVTAGKPITKLRLVLRSAKGGAPVGSAVIASLKAGASKVKLKTTKKLKAGKYILVANGVADGQTLGMTQKVSVKK